MRKLAFAFLVTFGCGDSGGGGGGGDGGIGGDGGDGGTGGDGGGFLEPDMGVPGLPVGSPCTDSDQCEGGDLPALCVPDSQGFPGGYCTATGCSPADQDCPGGTEEALCLMGMPPFCADVCDPAAPNCREGYGCAPLMSGAGVCLPADEDASIGDPCESIGDCPPGAFCAPEDFTGLPGGACITGCDPDMPMCPAGATCIETGGGGPGPDGVCLDACDPDAPDCRDAYACVEAPEGAVCYADCTSDDQCTVPGNVCRLDGTCGEPFDPDDLGVPCEDMFDCPGGFCIPEDPFGFPDGYCATLCDPVAPDCPGDGVCVLGDDDGDGTCLDGCASDADCRAGYDCAAFEGGAACWPTIDATDIGQPCAGPGECDGGFCLTETEEGWPGGYCIGYPCDAVDQDCPGDDAVCVDSDDDDGSAVGACADGCAADTDCRADYVCRDFGDGGICFPEFDWADFGQPCEGGPDCVGGLCMDEAETGWPGGLCAYGPCSVSAADCPDGLCYAEKGTDEGVCVPACATDAECRDGYDCAGGVWCLPGCDDDTVCDASGCCDVDAGTCGPCG